ncbi:MAG: UbiX family flavin prenyltransferase [Sterolibacterium sp.]|nr:UbiX family flavin prenyltransferase [Sterolibacterium sp.]
MNPSSQLPLLVAITGATGVIYGVELLRVLRQLGVSAHLVMSEAALMTLAIETELTADEVRRLADVVYANKDIGAAVASGSFLTRGMIIAPCSIKTLSAVANSYSDTLISRAADVMLKERRPLVMMVRETPLHKGHLQLMLRATDHGAVILPPMPAFYDQPQSLLDMVHQGIGKALDQFGIEHNLRPRWQGRPRGGVST